MVEKTKSCGLIWNQPSPSQYRARYLDYDFIVSRTNYNYYSFDVLKEGKFYRSYNSSLQEGVDTLFNEIELSYRESNIEKYKTLGSFFSRINTCRDKVFNTYTIPVLNFGVLGSGSLNAEQLRPLPTPALLTPSNLIFGPSPFPWSGSLNDILTNDGGTSYLRQQVSGEFPTNWGYAFIEFDPTPIIDLLPPYKVRVQVSHERELNGGVYLNLDVLINGAVVYSKTDLDSYESTTSFTLEDTGLQLTSSGPTYIDTVVLRLYMFTNTGNIDPRALRISYVSLSINGYNQIM